MPLPKPKSGEKKDAFISRCMGDDKVNTEYPKREQRFAVCQSQWGRKENTENKATPKTNSLRHLMSSLVRRETLEGREYLVAPTVLMTEGVHNETLYSNDELSKFPEAWNGRPLVLFHPMKDGTPVTANSPEQQVRSQVGKLFHTKVDNARLKSEAWIDLQKALELEVGKELIELLENNGKVEVSTGLFVDEEIVDGEWNGEPYHRVAYNYRPDHLALLPGGKGACSWEDGAGLPRINSESEEGNTNVVRAAIKDLAMTLGFRVQEISHDSIRSNLQSMVRDHLDPDKNQFAFIRDVFDKSFVYETESEGELKMFRQGYTVGEDDSVHLVDEPMEVMLKVEYVTVNSEENKNGTTDNNKQEGGSVMDRKTRVEALIANQASGWTEEDREVLMNLADVQFDKIEKTAPKKEDVPPEPKKEEEPTTNAKKDGEEKPADKVTTLEAFLSSTEVPAEVRSVLRANIREQKARKAELVGKLKANKRNRFTDDQLAAKEIEELEALVALSAEEESGSYEGRSTTRRTVTDTDEPEAMPDINWDGAAKKA